MHVYHSFKKVYYFCTQESWSVIIMILNDLIENNFHSCKKLFSTDYDLLWWQLETVVSCIPQFGGESISSTKITFIPIIRRTSGRIYNKADKVIVIEACTTPTEICRICRDKISVVNIVKCF